MSAALEPEILGPETGRRAHVRVEGGRVLGVFGAVLAVLTMLAAVGVGFLFFFGTTLTSALLVYAAWPLVFGPEFTQWVFGEPHASFLKLLLLFAAAGAVVKLFRRKF